jgi:hypothetical protein
VKILFQNPRQGWGTIDPRFTGGAVTELGCRNSRGMTRLSCPTREE